MKNAINYDGNGVKPSFNDSLVFHETDKNRLTCASVWKGNVMSKKSGEANTGGMVQNRALSFISYNIEGLSCLFNPELRMDVDKFDFVLLVETFTTKFLSGPMWFPNHTVFTSPAIKISNTAVGRLSGGVILLIKKNLMKYVQRVPVNYDNIIAIKLSKELFGADKDVILLGVHTATIFQIL